MYWCLLVNPLNIVLVFALARTVLFRWVASMLYSYKMEFSSNELLVYEMIFIVQTLSNIDIDISLFLLRKFSVLHHIMK